MRIIFIRHGDPDYVHDSLTEKGFREAKLLGKRAKNWDVDDVYVSPLGRAQKTAEYVLEATNKTAITYDWLKEFYVRITDPETGHDRIPWDFMPKVWTSWKESYDINEWYKHPVMQTGDVEQEFKKVCTEFDKLLSGYGYVRKDNYYETQAGGELGKASEKTIVFVCHLGVSFVMMAHLLGISPMLLWHGFFVAPTSVTVLNSEERVKNQAFFRVQEFGDVRHLFEGNEPISGSGYFTDVFQG